MKENQQTLNKVLRKKFDKVLEWDYESIFTKTVLDEITFEDNFLPVLKRQVEELNHLDFKDLKADIIGAIYNTLIDNQEQHDRGQHFTNTNEVDIVNGFCINKNTHTIIDTGCGAGTFLVRAYKFLQYFHPNKTHEQLLELIWGIEIAPFPVFLSTMNLCLLNVKSIDNYPIVINEDFCKIKSKNYFKVKFKHENKILKVKNLQEREAEVQIPEFDACVGNPPYIRQELIEHKDCWLKNVEDEWNIKSINKQSDLYVYYLMHTANLLKDGKRLGYVIRVC
jgi:type I restriction-modification system DNA methylase subunit